VTPVTGPNGQYGYLQITCRTGHPTCAELAARSCPKGYDIINDREDGSRYTSPGGLDETLGTPGANGSLLVACK
jgi:hypothetical protein